MSTIDLNDLSVETYSEDEIPLGDWVTRSFDSGLFQECEATQTLRRAVRLLKPSFALGTYIAGGLLVRSVMGLDQVNDVDYFSNMGKGREEAAKRLDPEAFLKRKGSAYFDAFEVVAHGMRLQFCRVSSAPCYTLESFPTFHCMIATDGRDILYHKNTLRDITERKATLHNKFYGYIGWFKKYENLGFTITNRELIIHQNTPIIPPTPAT